MQFFEIKSRLKGIDRKAFNREMLHSSLDLLPNLGGFNSRLSVQEPDAIGSLIIGNPGFELAPFNAHSSTPDDPRIILEHGASFCSLLIVLDREGNVASLHQPLVERTDQEVQKSLEDTGFMVALEKVGSERIYFLTGTNVSIGLQKRLLEQLTKIFGQEIEYLFLEQEGFENVDISKGKTSWEKLKSKVKDLLKGFYREIGQHRLIGEIFIIPSFVSATGKTELVLPHSKKKNGRFTQYVELKRCVDKLRSRLNHSADD